MKPIEHVAQLRHHITVVTSDPGWNADSMAEYLAALVDQQEGMDRIVSVEVFDENHELAEMRSTLDKAFRVIGTGAIHLLEQEDGWDRFRLLLETLKAFIERSQKYTSLASDPQYREGEEDGYVSAINELHKIVEMCEEKR